VKISKSKVLLLSFFLFWIGVGYGTYWWYQFSLDRQALESLPYEGPLLDRVYELVVGPDKDLSKAEQKLAELAEYHRARILVELSSDNDASVRSFAIKQMVPLADNPLVRTRLAYLTATDEEPKNRSAAQKVLAAQKL